MREIDVMVKGEFDLSATLTLPSNSEEKYPVIVMIHGSGPVDRDENAKSLKINAFKEFTTILTSEGYATLRYDKRGIGESRGDYYKTGYYDLIDDAVDVVKFAKSHESIDEERIYLLAHSEGCLVSPVVHTRTTVQGMILLSPSAEPLAETTAWQRSQMKEDMQTLSGFQGWLLRFIKADKKLDKMNDKMTRKIKSTDAPTIRYNGQKINAKWNREHEKFDVREYFSEVECPVIAITGSKDVQVKKEQVKDVCLLVKGECEHYIVDDLTHVLRKTKVEHRFSSIINDYKKQVKHPIDSELIELVSEWLKKR
ncbi:alpha/beta hydrolase family protein [Pseudalkalibacillus sp. NRS-1564]|uniref:alpha/beta hydrolase family protein n=1 Tax=Pseudalkalibacillus sp. NRS-1564 TaxID=3233900 RepID=UPI003D2ABB3E